VNGGGGTSFTDHGHFSIGPETPAKERKAFFDQVQERRCKDFEEWLQSHTLTAAQFRRLFDALMNAKKEKQYGPTHNAWPW